MGKYFKKLIIYLLISATIFTYFNVWATASNVQRESALTLTESSVTLTLGGTHKLSPLNVDGIICWSTSDPSVVRVDPTGVISAESPGVAAITVENVSGSGGRDECLVTVIPQLGIGYFSSKLEYPNGDELSAALMLLDFYGIKVDFDGLYQLLPHGNIPQINEETGLLTGGDPWFQFVGSPDEVGYGCCVTVIAQAFTSFGCLLEYGCRLPDGVSATDGYYPLESDQFIEYAKDSIDSGIPVMFWGTSTSGGILNDPLEGALWITDDGDFYQAVTNSSVLVIKGYKEEVFIVNDPINGEDREVSFDSVSTIYDKCGSQYLRLIPESDNDTPPVVSRFNVMKVKSGADYALSLISGYSPVFGTSDDSVAVITDSGTLTAVGRGWCIATLADEDSRTQVLVIVE